MTDTAPGEWPVDEPVDLVPADMYAQRAAERARHELILDNIRTHLDEQPSRAAVYAAVRHWISDITALGEDVAKTKPSTS